MLAKPTAPGSWLEMQTPGHVLRPTESTPTCILTRSPDASCILKFGKHKPTCPQPCLRRRDCLISLKYLTLAVGRVEVVRREGGVVVKILIRTARRYPFVLHFPSCWHSWHTRECSLQLQHPVWKPSLGGTRLLMAPWL